MVLGEGAPICLLQPPRMVPGASQQFASSTSFPQGMQLCLQIPGGAGRSPGTLSRSVCGESCCSSIGSIKSWLVGRSGDAVAEDTRTIRNVDEVVESVLGSERLGLGSCSGESQGWKLQVRNLPQNTEFAIFRGSLAPGELWKAAGTSPLL